MKTARIITGIAAGILAATLCTLVAVEWHAQGCGTWSLVAGCTMHAVMIAAIWNTIDHALKEREQ